MINHTTPEIAQQRRTEMMAHASQRSLARSARAAGRPRRSPGRLQALLTSLFTRHPRPAPVEIPSPAPAPAPAADSATNGHRPVKAA
jgi:hypothetical protein